MNHTSARWKGQLRQTLVLSLITICAAQINLHVFTETFTISLGSVCIPAFLYLLDDVAVIPLSVISGFGVFGSRVLIHALRTGSTAGAVSDYLPEVIFYVALGTLLYLFDRIGGHRKKFFHISQASSASTTCRTCWNSSPVSRGRHTAGIHRSCW